MSIFKDIVATVAPVLGTALGGPLGGAATTMILEKLGVDTEKAAVETMTADPGALLKLKEAEYDFKKYMAELKIKEKDLHRQDRDSARKLAIERGIVIQAALTGLFITGYFVLIYWFFSGSVAQGLGEWSKGQLGILIGVLTAAIPQMLNFWFGSSEGSKRKTLSMAEQR